MTPTSDTLKGTVVQFDAEAGLGVVAAGGDSYPFHCTQIADGSRTIAEGTVVAFRVAAAHLGQWEAYGITPE